MYGKSKNDVYKNSKWSSEKSLKSSDQRSRNDIDLNSESDYEDKTEQSYEKPVSYNDYFTKLSSTINDIKTDIKPNQNKLNEKIDTILEYIKSIDSDTKNEFELLCRIEKNTLPMNDHTCHCEEIKNYLVSMPAISVSPVTHVGSSEKDKINGFDEDNLTAVIKESYRLNNLNNKSRLRMDILPLKIETLSADVEQLHYDVNTLLNVQHNTNLLLNKLIIDNTGLRNTNLLLHQKLDLLNIQPIKNGSLTPVKNGSLSPIENGSLSPIENGSLTPVKNGSLTPVKNGSLTPIKSALTCDTQPLTCEEKLLCDKQSDQSILEDNLSVSNEESEDDHDLIHGEGVENESIPSSDFVENVSITPIELQIENNLSKSETDVEDISSRYYKITDKPKSVRSVPIKQKNKKK